jgi:hypothetical protein
MSLGSFMEANWDGFTPFDAMEIIQNLLNTGKHLGDEGSGGTWPVEIAAQKPLQGREWDRSEQL